MAKRAATTDLNHSNWDREEEPEEAGIFQKASSEVLESRVIKTAKRRVRHDGSTESKPSPFAGFSGFGASSSSSNVNSTFSFLSQKKSDEAKTNGTDQDSGLSSKESQTHTSTFTNSPFSGLGKQKDMQSSWSSCSSIKNSTDSTFKPFENVFNPSKASGETDKKSQTTDSKTTDTELLKDLNLSCSSWISEQLQKNPYCILTPIFKDYEKHLSQLNLETLANKDNKDIKEESEKPSTTDSSTSVTSKSFSFIKDGSSGSNQTEQEEKKEETEKPKTPQFKFEGTTTNSFNFQLGSVNSTSFGGGSTFSFNQIAQPPDSESKKDDEESEEPPKNDFVPVVEEDSIFDMKCKIFVKKDGNFVSRGVGTLFLKPVKENKTQAVVRAHTSLGNILLNILLTPGMPIKKTGKNNVMIVCVPTPEAKPPPIPVLIRVKTSEECDSLIKKLEECRES